MAFDGKLALVGGGNMGSALLRGMIKQGFCSPDQVQVAEKDPQRGADLARELGVTVTEEPGGLAPVELLIAATKPLDLTAALQAATGALTPSTLVISLAAGTTIATVVGALPPGQPVVRAMPNTPALVGAGATALAAGPGVGEAQLVLAQEVFSAAGLVVVVPERLMDTVTGLSGSGPAYVFLMIEALADAGVAEGLDRATALKLAGQTVLGAGKLMMEGGDHPALLRERVTSPGGTTAAGLHALEQGGFKGLVMDGVIAAIARAREMAKG